MRICVRFAAIFYVERVTVLTMTWSYVRTGADWTVGKSVIYRIKFTKKKEKKKKKKKEERIKKRNKRNNIKKENSEGKTKTYIDQKGPLIYALNLTKKGLQIFMRRI